MSTAERVLTDEMVEAIKAYFPRYPSKQAVTLPALHLVNEKLRYVPRQAVVEIARLLELAPAEVWDDGQSTFLRFPGNRRVPTIFSVLPDGREAAVNYSVNTTGVITVHQTGPALRLRDGGLVLCIFNRAADATGRNPGTGTTSPDVVREIRR